MRKVLIFVDILFLSERHQNILNLFMYRLMNICYNSSLNMSISFYEINYVSLLSICLGRYRYARRQRYTGKKMQVTSQYYDHVNNIIL